jgi:ribosomal protein S18 acetylase RimI-like enzyme
MADLTAKLRAGFQDLIHCLRHGRIDDAGRLLSEKLRTLLYCRIEYLVLTRSLEEPLPCLKARLPVTYRIARPDDLSYLRDAVLPSELAYFRNRLAHGRNCVMGFYQDNAASYGWITDEVTFEIDNLRLRLGPGDAYLDDIYTLPAYRHQGIGGELHLRRLQYLKEHGFKQSIIIVRVDNVPSLKIAEKLGYQEADRLTFRRTLLQRDYHYHKGKF